MLDQNEVITLYNLNNASNADFNSAMVDRSSSDNKSLYTGMEASFSMRFLAGSTLFGSWTAERNTSVFCESDDNPNGPTSNDLYQGRPVSQGGRFCDQRKFDIPFIHEFKLAGNYQLPKVGVDFGAVLQSYAGLERVITWQPAATLYPGGQRTQAQTIVMNEPGSLYTERWDQLDINFKKNIRYGNKVHTFQLDLFNVFNNNSIRTRDRLRRHVARTGDGDHAWAFPEAGVSVQVLVTRVKRKANKSTLQHSTGGPSNQARPFCFLYSFFVIRFSLQVQARPLRLSCGSDAP